jgi:hypothetical protein
VTLISIRKASWRGILAIAVGVAAFTSITVFAGTHSAPSGQFAVDTREAQIRISLVSLLRAAYPERYNLTLRVQVEYSVAGQWLPLRGADVLCAVEGMNGTIHAPSLSEVPPAEGTGGATGIYETVVFLSRREYGPGIVTLDTQVRKEINGVWVSGREVFSTEITSASVTFLEGGFSNLSAIRQVVAGQFSWWRGRCG